MQKRGSGPAADRDLEQLAAFFKLLSDKTRVKIILLLAQGDRHVTSLCEELNLPQPTISHHLGLLRMSNIVGNRRQGKQVFYGADGRFETPKGAAIEFNVAGHIIRISSNGVKDAVV
jgi:DNA-binding transcriptional ArsR family regulator